MIGRKSNFLSSSRVAHAADTETGLPEVSPMDAQPQAETYTPELFREYEMEQYRKRFPKETKGMTDAQIFDVAMSTEDDLEDDEWRALFGDANPNAETDLPNLDGEELANRAKSLGAKGGREMTEAMETVMKAKEDWAGGPFRVLFALQQDYTREELDGFAVPDSETGNNPDYFKVPKTDAKNKTRMVETTFYTQFADGTATGQNILARIEWTERAGDSKAVKDDIPEDIKAMDPVQRETHLNFLKGRRNTIRQSYKKAMALYFQFKAVENYPGIAADCIWVPGKSPEDAAAGKCDIPEVENTTKPIQVWLVPAEGKPIAKWEAMSIGAFMKLDPNKGLEKGGTFQSLIESGVVKKSKAGTGATSDKPEGLTIKTIDTGVSVFAEFHRWLEEIATAKDKAEYGKLLKLGNTKDNDEFIVAIVETRNMLADLAKEIKADDKYVKLQQGGSELISEIAKPKAA